MIEDQDFLPVSQDEMHERGWWLVRHTARDGRRVCRSPVRSARPSSGALLENDGLPRGGARAARRGTTASAFAAMGQAASSAFSSARAILTAWSRTTRRRKSAAARTSIPPAGRPGCARTAQLHRVRQPRARRRSPGMSRTASAGWRPRCAASRITTTGTTRSAGAILVDARADILVYGMGESATLEARRPPAADGKPFPDARHPRHGGHCRQSAGMRVDWCTLPSFDEVCDDAKRIYAARHARRNTPSTTPSAARRSRRRTAINSLSSTRRPCRSKRRSWTAVAALPYTQASPTRCTSRSAAFRPSRRCSFSVIHNRGCFGGCNFCALAFHQGQDGHEPAATNPSSARSRAADATFRDFEGLYQRCRRPDGELPPAPVLQKAEPSTACVRRQALPCADAVPESRRGPLATIWRCCASCAPIPGVKKVFVRSGMRFDYVL